MHRTATLVLVLALIAPTLPTATAASNDTELNIREANRAWILDYNPNYNPDAIVELHTNDGVEHVTAAEALERTLNRADTPRLTHAPAMAGESSLTETLIGDIWLIGTGDVRCGDASTVSQTPLTPISLGSQVHAYDGSLSYVTGTSATEWVATAWVQQESLAATGPVHYGGNVNDHCIEGEQFGLILAFLNGYVTTLASPPVIVQGPVI